MTEGNENNKTLKLGSSKKLTLSKTLDTSEIKHNFGRGKSRTVTVEVKKSKNLVKEKNQLNAEAVFKTGVQNAQSQAKELEAVDAKGLTQDERQTRLNALKVATQQSEEEKKRKVATQESLEAAKDFSPIVQNSDQEEILLNEQDNLPQVRKLSEEVRDEELSKAKNILEKVEEIAFVDGEEEEDSKVKKSSKVDKKSLVNKATREEKWSSKYNVSHLIGSEEDLENELDPLPRSSIKRYSKFKKSTVKRDKLVKEVVISGPISLKDLALRMAEKVGGLIKEAKELLGKGEMLNQPINVDTVIEADNAEILVMSLGHTPKRISKFDLEKDFEKRLVDNTDKKDLVTRAPIVTVMGHVDHGKTSLLDALRSTNVANSEAGGITQHVGAYKISTKTGQEIVFLDTPGHEAFTAIRLRGAKCTDIVVLVVAADDGVMPQTVEAINHAKMAEVAIVVAINKIDRPNANPSRVKNELLNHEVIVEEFGGDTLVVEISAKERLGLEQLEEAILMQAEILDLKASPNRSATGTVIESKMDKGRGIITNILVQNGTLKIGDIVVMGSSFGKVKKIIDDKGQSLSFASSSTPVEIIGLNSIADAGSSFAVIDDERKAREIVDLRMQKEKESKNLNLKRVNLDEFFSISEGKTKELRLIVKSDTHGSLEAINGSLAKILNEEVKVRLVHSAIGAITESDVSLAQVSNAIILGFNVRAESKARLLAEKSDVDIRYYNIIYNLIDDVQKLLGGLLSPVINEVYLGTAECRQIFDITKIGKIAGSHVLKGTIKRGAQVRLLRNNIVIHEGKLRTLRRFKDDVKEVKEGYECGIGFEHYDDVRIGDTIEAYELIEEKRE